ncbi:repetin-like [Varroa jacobsoni]|uniref:repetin-like n=1 Tax=Varroa jacobsoni TaxID=62625 RepID=UPI000BF6B5EA|nr:repetin-like [Varroa jacobsoni]
MTANQNQITNLGSTPKKLITDLVKFSSPIQSDSNHRNVGVFREKPQQKQLIPVIIIQETNALNAHVVADGSQLITSQEEDQQQGKYMRSSSPSEYGPGGRRVLTWNKQANESSSQPALQEARMKQQWPQGTGNTGFADNITLPGHSKKQQDTKDVWQVKQNQPNLDNRWIVHHQRDDSPWKPSPSLVNDTRKNTVKKPRWVITDNQNQAWTPSPSDTYGKSQHEKPHKHVDWNSQSLVQRQSEGLIREQAKGTSIDHIVPKGWVNSDGQHENSPSNYPISWTQLVAQPFHQEKTQTEQKRLWQDQAQQMQFDFPFQQPQHTKLLPPNELEQYPHGTRRSHHNESDWSPFDSQQNHFGPYMVKNVHQERAQPQKAILPTKTVPVHKQGQDLLTQTRSNDSSEKNVQQQLKQKSAETRLENNRPKNLRKILVPLYQQKTNVSNERHSSRQQVQEQQTSSRQLWDLFSWQYQQLPDTASWKPFRTEGHNTSDAFSSTSRIQTPAARPVSGGWPPNCNDGSQNELRQHLQQTESPQDQNRQQHQEHPQELHHTSHFGNSNLQWHDIYGYSRKKTSWREHHSQPTWTKGASESATEWSLQHDSGGDPTNNDGSGSTATAIGPTFSPIQKQHTNLTSKVRMRSVTTKSKNKPTGVLNYGH